MKRWTLLGLTLLLSAALTGCGQTPGLPEAEGLSEEEPAFLSETAPEKGEEHTPAQEPCMTEGYGQGGYCGNTVTTITAGGETFSFWGGDSVSLTDLLLYLDYSGSVCRCMPEYTVETEFSEDGYGVNLTEFYVRCGDGQAPLTEEQAEMIREIIEKNCVLEHKA